DSVPGKCTAARPDRTLRATSGRRGSLMREWAERRWLSARSLWVLCLDGRLKGGGALDGAFDRDALALLGGIEDGVHDLEDVQAEVAAGTGNSALAHGPGEISRADAARVLRVGHGDFHVLPLRLAALQVLDRAAEGVRVGQAE